MLRAACLTTALLGLAMPSAAIAQRAVPSERTLSSGWEMRVEPAAPALPQPAPPEETSPEGEGASLPRTPRGRAAQEPGEWHGTRVPSVFDTHALPSLYPGTVRRYRVTFPGPPTPRGFSWLIRFDSVRRNAAVILNGRRVGRNVDPYTPFTVPARGLRPGQSNELVVIVDGRKNPKLPEAWWNWNGIVRPVTLVPAGPAHIADLGTMSDVRCKGPASRCKASLLLDGILERRGVRTHQALPGGAPARAGRAHNHEDLPPAASSARSGAGSSCRCRFPPRSCGPRTTRASTPPRSPSRTAAAWCSASGAGSGFAPWR